MLSKLALLAMATAVNAQGKSNAYFGSQEYLDKTAQQKLDELWAEITADKEPGYFPFPLWLLF